MRKILAIIGLTLAVLLGATACNSHPPKKDAQQSTQQQTEDAFSQQQTAVPYPESQLLDSTERRNLRERLLRFNQPHRIGYVYLLSMTGQPTGYYVIDGKVSSTDSQMTTSQLIITKCHSGGCNDVTVPAPGDDGSYGPNETGIFFFTAEGTMIETSQPYVYSDSPIYTTLNLPKLNGGTKVKDISAR